MNGQSPVFGKGINSFYCDLRRRKGCGPIVGHLIWIQFLESIIIILNKNTQHSDDLDSGAFPNHAMNGKRPAAPKCHGAVPGRAGPVIWRE